MTPQNQRTIGWLVVIVGIIALAAPRLRSQGTSTSADPAAHFQKTFTIASGGTLDVDNYKGTIHVTGSDTNQVAVDVNKHFEGNDADRKWWMENVQVNFKNDNNRVSVEVKYPQWTCIFCWETTITLPQSSWKFAFPGKSMCSWKVTSPTSAWLEFRATFA